MKDFLHNLAGRFPQWGRDRAVRLLVLVGVVGMVLIALSECRRPDVSGGNDTAVVTVAQVEQALEQRITSLLDTVEGVGRCRVMVTLESEEQAVYAADTTQSETASSSAYLTVDTDGGPVGLLLTRIQPTVRGVVVVCTGAKDPAVCTRVQEVITTAFHISERRVCVVPQK